MIAGNPIIEGTLEKQGMTTECVVVTNTGRSIVNLNQPSCATRTDSAPGMEIADGSLILNSSNTDSKSISQLGDSAHESPKHDHITLLSVGGTSNTQFIADNL